MRRKQPAAQSLRCGIFRSPSCSWSPIATKSVRLMLWWWTWRNLFFFVSWLLVLGAGESSKPMWTYSIFFVYLYMFVFFFWFWVVLGDYFEALLVIVFYLGFLRPYGTFQVLPFGGWLAPLARFLFVTKETVRLLMLGVCSDDPNGLQNCQEKSPTFAHAGDLLFLQLLKGPWRDCDFFLSGYFRQILGVQWRLKNCMFERSKDQKGVLLGFNCGLFWGFTFKPLRVIR